MPKVCFTTYGKTYGTTPYVLPYVYHIVLPKMLLIEFKKGEKGGTKWHLFPPFVFQRKFF